MDREYLVGVSVDSENINAGLVDINGKIVKKFTLPTEASKGKKKVVENMALAVHKVFKPKVLGVGISVPGLISRDRGYVISAPELPGWTDLPLKKMVEERVKLPVFLENHANCFALAEYKCGELARTKNMVGVILNSTVSGGVIVDGKLYRGASDSAGELGKMIIADEYLDNYVGGNAIIDRYKSLSKTKKPITTAQIFEMSKSDAKARQVVNDAARYLGIGLANVVNVFNPEIIVVSGEFTNHKPIFDSAIKEMEKRAMKHSLNRVKVITSKVEDAGILGAASVVTKGFV